MGQERGLCNLKASLLLQTTPAWVLAPTLSISPLLVTPAPRESSAPFWPSKHRYTNNLKKKVLRWGWGESNHQDTCHHHRFIKGARAGNTGSKVELCPGIVAHGQLINPPFSVCSLEAQCRFIHALNRLFAHTSCGLAILTPWGSSSSNEWSR